MSDGSSTRHRHGRFVHRHPHRAPHRHLARPQRSRPVVKSPGHDHRHSHDHDHSHGLVDRSILRSRAGIKAVAISLLVLGLAAGAQAAIFVLSGSVALLADLIHNAGDAATAIPLGIAFALRSARAERLAGLAVVDAVHRARG